jgi:WD40 repeat protein/beta-lactamase regulating signal transducer with metallopeptidase domain
MIPVELLNTWGGFWFGLMTRTLLETTALLGVMLVLWLPLRKRMSAQLAHGLFCLVLLKLLIPIPVTGPAWQSVGWKLEATEWLSDWTSPGELSRPEPVAKSPDEPWSLPTTGDLGASLAEVSSPEPIRAVVQAVSPEGAGVSVTAPPVVERERPALRVQAVLMLAWSCCAGLLLARFAWAMKRTRRLMRQAVPLPPDRLPIDLDALPRALGLRSGVRWAVDQRLDSPAVGGLFRPAVIVPPDLHESLTPNQLTWVLLHELAHVRRGDLWVVMFQRVLQAVFFFNPAVHLANWIIDELREYACDDAALAACKTSRGECGEGFLTIIERSAGRPPVSAPALGLFEGKLLIRRRLVRILDNRRTIHARLSRPAACGLVVLAIALYVLPYGAPGRVSAGPHGNRSSAGASSVSIKERSRVPDEPASYRPGAVWHHQGMQDRGGTASEAGSSNGRTVVLAVAYSPDRTMLASAGDDAVIRLRDLASGRWAGELEGHEDAVSCLGFSPDGKTLATGSYDRTVKLWDLATRRLLKTFWGHTNWVFSLAFTPDGASLVTGGHDKTVRIWDIRTGRETARLAGHAASVRAIAVARGGSSTLIASGGADQAVLVWDLGTGLLRARLEGHKGMVRALALAADGATLAAGGEDGDVRLWDMKSNQLRATLSGHSDMVTCVAFSPGGEILASGSLDANVKLWEMSSSRERASLQGHLDGVSALAFAPDARQMATAGFDGSVRLWEPAAPIFSPTACLSYPGEPSNLAFAPDGRSVRAAGTAGIIRWDVRSGSALPPSVQDSATALAAAADGSRYATVGPGKKVVVYDGRSDKRLATFDGHGGNVRAIAFSADSRQIASGDENGVVRLWDAIALRPVGSLPALELPITCVQFSPDGKTLAVATCDLHESKKGEVTLWNVATRELIGALPGNAHGVRSVAFSPNGATIATASAVGVIRLWDVATRSARISLSYGDCRSVAFSPDGGVLASAHIGGDVVLWSSEGGRQLALLSGHRDEVSQVIFSPVGHSLATAGKAGTVKLWNLGTRRQTARATLKGDLTLVRSVAYSPDGKTLAVGDGPNDGTGTVTLWDAAARKVIATLGEHERGVVALVFSRDATSLASGSCDGTIRIWDLAKFTCRHELAGLSGVTELAYSPDGKFLASAGEGNIVTIWDVETGREACRLTDLRWPVYSVSFSPDGTRLATGGGAPDGRPGARGELKIWDVAKQSVVGSLDGHEKAVSAVCFSPDGRNLASGSLDETIRLWDVRTMRSGLTIGGMSHCVQALAFSPDGKMLAWSGRHDGLVSLCDPGTGAEVGRFVGHHGPVRGIAFAPDGSGMATGGDDRSIKLWDVQVQASSLSQSTMRSGENHGGSR